MLNYNIKDIQSLTIGRDEKEYASLGFPKGTIYEGYFVTIPYHASIINEENPWLAKVKLSESFTYYLSKIEIEIDEFGKPSPKKKTLKITSQELKDNYNKFTDQYIDGKRVSITSPKILQEIDEQIETAFYTMNRLVLNNEEREELLEPIIDKIREILSPEPVQKVNMRYIYDVFTSLKNHDYLGSKSNILEAINQLDVRFLNQKAFHLHKVALTVEEKSNSANLLKSTKELNSVHKI